MTSVSEVGRAFWEGRTKTGGGGKLASVTSAKIGRKLVLYEYGHAVLAERLPDGKVIIYDGWYGYSRTTSKHFGQLGLYREGNNIIRSNQKKSLDELEN